MGLPADRSSERSASWWLGCALFIFLTVIWFHPLGYIGGGMDDWRYLRAAQCLASDNQCLPREHWAGRWPITLPMAASIRLWGEHRLTVGLPGLAYALGCLLLSYHLLSRLIDRQLALAATALLAMVPDFSIRWMQPNIDMPELLFLLAAATCIAGYSKRQHWLWAGGAGLALGLAMQARETAIIAAPLLAYAAWQAGARTFRAWLAAGLGVALPFIIEFIIYGLWTGDPFYRRALSFHHAQIRSNNLPITAGTDTRPFLNPDIIKAWRHVPGIKVHWLVDGPINLLFNPLSGGLFLLNLLAAPLAWRAMEPADRRLCKIMATIILYWTLVIVYVVAVMPAPRMMFPALLAASAMLAVQVRALFRSRQNVGGYAIIAASLIVAVLTPLARPSTASVETQIGAALHQYPAQIEADRNSYNQLLLMPGHQQIAPIGGGRPLLLVQLLEPCAQWQKRQFPGALSPIAEFAMTPLPSAWVASPGHFCLFRYEKPVAPAAIRSARQGY